MRRLSGDSPAAPDAAMTDADRTAGMGKTLLRVTCRRVPVGLTQRYHEAWQRLRTEAARRDIRAWVFTSRDADGLFIEFAECRNMDDRALSSALASVDEQLDTVAPAEKSGIWQEWEGNGEGQ
jgi:hypothetical protein